MCQAAGSEKAYDALPCNTCKILMWSRCTGFAAAFGSVAAGQSSKQTDTRQVCISQAAVSNMSIVVGHGLPMAVCVCVCVSGCTARPVDC